MRSKTEKLAEIIKLSQNENAYGTPPLALKAIKDHCKSVFRYPDVHQVDLRQKIADKFDVTPDSVVISAGSVALMDMSIKAFVNSDENVVTAAVTFPGYKIMAEINRRTCKFASLVNHTIDLDNMLSQCDDKTKVVFIANPNNPTSTMFFHNDLERFLQSVNAGVYVVSDEAYAEYVTDEDYPDTLELLKIHRNLIIFRTFSKIYGLAGLRIGYAIAHPEVIKSLMRCKTPFSISSLANAAASAAMDDTEYVEKCAAVNAVERTWFCDELKNLGFNAIPPKANFIYIEFSKPGDNEKICDMLKNDGILARPLGPFGAENGLRISVGRPDENRRVIARLKRMELGLE